MEREAKGAPLPVFPCLWAQEALPHLPEQDGGASRCHDSVPSAGSPCAHMGREDPTLLGSHTGTWLHTSDLSHGGPPNTFMHEHPRAQRAGGLRGEGWVRRLPLFLSVKSWVREPTGGPPFPVISQNVTAPRQEGQSQPSPTVRVLDQNSCDKDPAHSAQGDGGRPARLSGVRCGWIRASSPTASAVEGSAQQPRPTPVQPWTSQDCVSPPRLGR